MQFHDEWAIDLLQNVSLGYTKIILNVSNMFAEGPVIQELTWCKRYLERLTLCFDEKVAFGDYLLLELFHGVIVLSAVAFNEVNFAK